MAKREHRMVPRRPAVLLALLASASHQTLLAAVTVGSFNAALVSSASAATCVTSVSPTFANVINDVAGQPGATVVTSVTPSMAPALNGVTTGAAPFLTSANLSPVFGNAVTSAALSPGTTGTAVTSATLSPVTGTVLTGATTGTVTGIPPTPGAPTNLFAPAFATNFPTAATNPPPPPPSPLPPPSPPVQDLL